MNKSEKAKKNVSTWQEDKMYYYHSLAKNKTMEETLMLNEMLKSYSEFIDDKIKNNVGYKPNGENFELYIEYLKTHPQKATYEDFKKFKQNK